MRRFKERSALAIVISFVLLLFGYVQFLEPHFFNYGDNAAYFLPAYVYNWRSIVENGSLPFITFHQLLGQIYLGQSQTSVLYPFTLIAVGLSKIFTGNVFSTIDLLALGHLAGAVVGMYYLLRFYKIPTALRVGICCLWISFPMYFGQSKEWINIAYITLFLPWTWLSLERLITRPTIARVIILALLHALLVLQGYIQHPFFLLEFEALFLTIIGIRAWRRGQLKSFRKSIFFYIASIGLMVATILPLMLPVLFTQQQSFYRSQKIPFADFILSHIETKTFLSIQFFQIATHNQQYIQYIGIPILIIPLLLLWVPLWKKFVQHSTAHHLLLAIIALTLATQFYALFYLLPWFNIFRWPLKYVVFLLFFLSVAIAGIWHSWYSLVSPKWRSLPVALVVAGIILNISVLTWYHLGPQHRHWHIDQATIDPPPIVATIDRSKGRLFTYKTYYETISPYAKVMGYNHAQLYEYFHFAGYDPLMSQVHHGITLLDQWLDDGTLVFGSTMTQELLDHFSYWGVRYIIAPRHDQPLSEEQHQAKTNAGDLKKLQPYLRGELDQFEQLAVIHEADDLVLYENNLARPFAYDTSQPLQPLSVQFNVNDMLVTLAPKSATRNITLNVVPLANFKYEIDGQDMGYITSHGNQAVSVKVPAGAKSIRLHYHDRQFWVGVYLAGFVWLAVMVVIVLRSRRARPPSPQQVTTSVKPSGTAPRNGNL